MNIKREKGYRNARNQNSKFVTFSKMIWNRGVSTYVLTSLWWEKAHKCWPGSDENKILKLYLKIKMFFVNEMKKSLLTKEGLCLKLTCCLRQAAVQSEGATSPIGLSSVICMKQGIQEHNLTLNLSWHWPLSWCPGTAAIKLASWETTKYKNSDT